MHGLLRYQYRTGKEQMRSNGAARTAFGPGCSGARGRANARARRPAGSAGQKCSRPAGKKEKSASRTANNKRWNADFTWSWQQESNLQPADYKSAALPVELCQRSEYSVAQQGRFCQSVCGAFAKGVRRPPCPGLKAGRTEKPPAGARNSRPAGGMVAACAARRVRLSR